MNAPEVAEVPRHVAIIMDGNGRWAKQRNLPRMKGHEKGAESVKATIRAAADAGVEYLTLYAFSVENWSRPAKEVKALMSLLVRVLDDYKRDLPKENVRLRAIGRLSDLDDKVLKKLDETIKKTASNTGLTLQLALSYGARVELTEAMQNLGQKVKAGDLTPEEITEEHISSELYTTDAPDPDLLIRTSGERRLSNFLLWQLSYAELYFTPVLWPEFGKEQLEEAFQEYRHRQRRFGGV